MGFLRMTDMAHLLLAQYVQEGDTVIDATAGNGYDTLFLAQKVGDAGIVHAFDVQREAIENTRERLKDHNLSHRVRLHHTTHTDISKLNTPVKAVVFNLGYLPGSDKEIVTQGATTCGAVAAALSLLQSGGAVVIVLYRGHAGGEQEAADVEAYVRQLSHSSYVVSKYEHINVSPTSPYILLIVKK